MARRTWLLGVVCAIAAYPSAALGAGWIPPQPFFSGANVGDLDMNEAGDAALLSSMSDGTGPFWRLHASVHRRGSSGWGAQEAISTVGAHANYAAVELDPAGTALAMWVRQDPWPHIQASTRGLAGTWSAPVNVTPPTDTGGWGVPDFAFDSQGNALAVWVNSHDYRLYAAYRPASGGWSMPYPISTLRARLRALSVNAAGKAVVVWESSEDAAIKASQGQGGAWQPPVTISPVSTQMFSVAVAVGPSGEAVAAWSHDTAANVNEPVEAVFMSAGGDWQEPETLSAFGRSTTVQLGIDAMGNFTAAWQVETSEAGESIWVATRRAGTGWQAPQQVASGGEWPQLSVSANGRAVLAWSARRVAQAVVRSSVDSGWSSVYNVRSTVTGNVYPRVALDGLGHALATWSYERPDASVTSEWSVHDTVAPTLTAVSVPPRATVGQYADLSAAGFDSWSPLVRPIWDFGDGRPLQGNTVSQLFDRPGTHIVSVTQADLADNAATSSHSIEVVAAPRPPAPSPPVRRCVVPRLKGKTFVQAKRMLVKTRCSLGRVTRARSRRSLRGRVIAQRPKAGTRLPVRSKVRVTLGRGR